MSKKHVLIVEDSEIVARPLQRALQFQLGDAYEVDVCDSAEEALERIQGSNITLLISDLRLPATNGLTLIRQVKEISPQTRRMLMTAFGSLEIEKEAHRLDAVYLSKPFSLQDFSEAVQKLLKDE